MGEESLPCTTCCITSRCVWSGRIWDKNVLENALAILEKMLNGENPVVKPLSRIVIQDDRHAHVCEICDNRLILGEENRRKHLVSKSHKWHVKRERRKEQQ